MIVKTLTPQEAITGVVYAIYCECVGHVYIGETGMNLKTGVTEHQRSVRNWDKNNATVCHIAVSQ